MHRGQMRDEVIEPFAIGVRTNLSGCDAHVRCSNSFPEHRCPCFVCFMLSTCLLGYMHMRRPIDR
jgi:hypothetical protein